MKHAFFALALVMMAFVAPAQEIMKLSNPVASQDKEGWTGNVAVSSFVRLEDAEFAIAPRAFDQNLQGLMTKVKFYRNPYEEYNTTSYTLKIYERPNLVLVNESLGLYDLNSCGELVYEQSFTSTTTGWDEVELVEPYLITDDDFWVSIKMNGLGTVVIGNENNASEGDYFYTKMYEYVNYWSYSYFFNSAYDYILYDCGLAVYTTELNNCNPPTDLQGEYIWHEEEDFGVMLSWKAPEGNPEYYRVYRTWPNSCPAVVAEPTELYYYDDVVVPGMEYIYRVTAVYADGCESEPAETYVIVTGVGECSDKVSVYPNPSNGMITVCVDGSQTIDIYDCTGHLVYTFDANGQTTLSLNSGVYFLVAGSRVEKVVVK